MQPDDDVTEEIVSCVTLNLAVSLNWGVVGQQNSYILILTAGRLVACMKGRMRPF